MVVKISLKQTNDHFFLLLPCDVWFWLSKKSWLSTWFNIYDTVTCITLLASYDWGWLRHLTFCTFLLKLNYKGRVTDRWIKYFFVQWHRPILSHSMNTYQTEIWNVIELRWPTTWVKIYEHTLLSRKWIVYALFFLKYPHLVTNVVRYSILLACYVFHWNGVAIQQYFTPS